MKYAILTFGCRVNQADSFEFEESLRTRGGVATPPEDADLVVVNTCTVTGAADQGARNLIRRIARDNASARIIVTGCYATREPGDLAALPQVVRIVPNDEKDRFVAMLRSVSAGDVVAGRFGDGDGEGPCGATIEPGVMGRTAYPLRVQTGCDETCAFCVIPSTRGQSRSREWSAIRADVERLAAAGYKEIWLVGVHLGSYGRDLADATSLTALLRRLDGLPGSVTFRISSLEPMDCSRELVDIMADSGRFAPHVHLPLQHGSDAMLALMRRPYTVSCYNDLVQHIHARLPHASIGTDMVVGFPGEREADAETSAVLVDRLPLSYLHVFPYSDRPGTAAAAMHPKVHPREAKRRAEGLRAIGQRKAAAFARAQLGSVRPGLTIDDGTTVLTDNFLKVRIPPGLPRNTRVQVRLDAADPALTGHVLSHAT
ncbi:MAG: MiaB/RimO family radical SAM methylthiotransferase [Acidobacteria bacterium]|nr:MiaB/RimO family radical SAM methylthiotransferase [Acidobacteriota bacterium]